MAAAHKKLLGLRPPAVGAGYPPTSGGKISVMMVLIDHLIVDSFSESLRDGSTDQ